MTDRSEAARKAWETRKRNAAKKAKNAVFSLPTPPQVKRSAESEAAMKAWKTRRAKEDEEERGRLEDIKYLDRLIQPEGVADEEAEEP